MINGITRMPDGSVIGVGMYYDAPITSGVYREMVMLWPPNSVSANDAACLGGTRYWNASDKDFALARFRTDELFSDSWGD